MGWSNAQKLAAIISEWAQPALCQLMSMKIGGMPWLREMEDGVRKMGIVGADYSIARELEPLIQPMASQLVRPMLEAQLGRIPDEQIPRMAREMVKALDNQGGLKLMGGMIMIERSDIMELKSLINLNLPEEVAEEVEQYKIIRNE